MRKITLSEYNSIPKDYRGIWTVERWDLPNWAEIREKHMGKRTMMVYDKGTCLLVEGLGFEIVDDSIWKKADEVKIFFYCDSLENLKSLADKGKEDFIIAGCIGFGIYEELLQTT